MPLTFYKTGLILLSATLFTSARVAVPPHKTLKDLDEEASRNPHTFNYDAPPAVARVKDSGDVQDALNGDDSTLQEALAGLAPSTNISVSTPDVSLNTGDSSRLHHVEHLLARAGLRQQTSTVLLLSNLIPYAHLLLLTSRSHLYLAEMVQFIAYVCFPTLPLLQLLSNLCKTVATAVYQRSSPLKDTSFFLAAMCGQYVLPPGSNVPIFSEPRLRLADTSVHDLDRRRSKVRDASWLAQLPLLAATLLASATALHVWHDHPTRSDWDAAAIAQDARAGWLALSGTLAAAQAIVAHATPVRWALRPQRAPTTAPGLLAEADVFAEIAGAALMQDAIAAASGGASLVGLVGSLAAYQVVLIGLMFAMVLIAYSVRGTGGGLLGTRVTRYGGLRALVVVLSAALCACIVLFHGCTALLEWRGLSGEPWLEADEALMQVQAGRSLVV